MKVSEQGLDFEKKMQETAIICERDYFAQYERFALTKQEFLKRYEEFGPFDFTGNTFTLKLCIHMYYKEVVIGGKEWEDFFTDMEDGLPESDVEDGNLAYVRNDLSESLAPMVEKTVAEFVRKYGEK